MINARACGGMVDTLVLGTSAKAWEFESLHAHHLKGLSEKVLFLMPNSPDNSGVFPKERIRFRAYF